MTDERSSSSILRKTISEPQTDIKPATFHCMWLPLRSHICRTYTLAYHLRLGSSMTRASHRSSEGYGFDLRLGLRIRFSEDIA